MNYVEYFIPKYQSPSSPITYIEGTTLPSTGDAKTDTKLKQRANLATGALEINGPEKWYVDLVATDGLFKGVGLLGKGLWKGARLVAPKTTGAISTGVKTASNAVKYSISKVADKTKSFLKRPPIGKVVEVSIPSGQLEGSMYKVVDQSGKVWDLPEYAIPNADPEYALELTKTRLRQGGNKRLQNAIKEGTEEQIKTWENSNLVKGNKNTLRFYEDATAIEEDPIYESVAIINKSLKRNAAAEDLGGSLNQYAYWKYTDAPKTPGTIIDAHEFSHYYHTPVDLPKGINWGYVAKEYGDEGIRYFKNLNGTEVAARGNQLKNYFGLYEGEEITPEMWKYAKENYVKDVGYDNNMTDFFNMIDESKLSEFLKWLNKNAPVISAPLAIGSGTLITGKHQNGGKLNNIELKPNVEFPITLPRKKIKLSSGHSF